MMMSCWGSHWTHWFDVLSLRVCVGEKSLWSVFVISMWYLECEHEDDQLFSSSLSATWTPRGKDKDRNVEHQSLFLTLGKMWYTWMNSPQCLISSGISQGYCLIPLMFHIYTNNLPWVLTSVVVKTKTTETKTLQRPESTETETSPRHLAVETKTRSRPFYWNNVFYFYTSTHNSSLTWQSLVCASHILGTKYGSFHRCCSVILLVTTFVDLFVDRFYQPILAYHRYINISVYIVWYKNLIYKLQIQNGESHSSRVCFNGG